ncbi:MAG TPA: aminotransferase, partial [Planctomycetota bacterium]|nr:aminotransferase [Planctomycetota bacterium]
MGKLSAKAARFSESVIREMSRVCTLEGGVNLAQGFPDFPAPQPMKAAACRAIQADVNQYA